MTAVGPLLARATPESTLPPASPRIAALDGLRAIAMLLVVAVHCYSMVPALPGSAGQDFFRRIASLGYTGVDLFFVLSGLLIGGILLDHRSSPRLLPAFYARRCLRILPVYLLLLAFFYLCRGIPGLNATDHGAYFRSRVPDWCYFVFVQNVAMAWIYSVGPAWLGPTWSLAVEEQFYLAAPALIRRLSVVQVAWCSGLVIALSPVLRLFTLEYVHNPLAGVYLLVTRADGLMWGVLCACLLRSATVRAGLQRRGAVLTTLIVGGCVVFGYASLQHYPPGSPQMLGWGYSALSAWFAAIVLGVMLFPQAWAAQLLGWRPLTIIGVTSYFSYLFHFPILLLLHWLFFHAPPQNINWQTGGVTALAIFMTLAAAWVSGRWFDGPLTRLGRCFSYE